MDDFLAGSPYSLSPEALGEIWQAVQRLEERVALLRSQQKLTPSTLAAYYGRTRFEQIAESNAIEGSTLDAGETELAVLKGVTLAGHDPGYVRDAQSLAKALDRLAELAKERKAVDIAEVKEIHELVLEGRPSAGAFRTEPVRIRGSNLRPPKRWRDVMDAMEQWARWSLDHEIEPGPIRAVVLHTWFEAIHPFIDGNGRTGRAVGNLELIRRGYPPTIIRARKDRSRYLAALATSDEAGDIAPMFELVIERLEDALRDLERAASEGQGYDRFAAAIRREQERRLGVWNAAVQLLGQAIAFELDQAASKVGGTSEVEVFNEALGLDDYIALCARQTISRSWAFRIRLDVPGMTPFERLAWTGFRSHATVQAMPTNVAATPSLFWSRRNPGRFPPWIQVEGAGAPVGDEFTLHGDTWVVRRNTNTERVLPTELARRVVEEVVAKLE